MGDYASVSVTVPSGRGFCACFKHGAVFANSAMSVRGGFLLRLQILMGLLREKTGRARTTPPLYSDGFSRDWTLACQSSLFVDFVFVSWFSWTMAAPIPICFLDFSDFGKGIFYAALSRHCRVTFQQLSRASPDVQDQRK